VWPSSMLSSIDAGVPYSLAASIRPKAVRAPAGA
jgi:hypothetical protein